MNATFDKATRFDINKANDPFRTYTFWFQNVTTKPDHIYRLFASIRRKEHYY